MDADPTNDCFSCSQSSAACGVPWQNCQNNPSCVSLIDCFAACPADNPATPADEYFDCICTNDGSTCNVPSNPGTCVGDYPNGVDDYIAATDCTLGNGMVDGECTASCAPTQTSPCNPVTGTGCNSATGEACDFDGGSSYTCYAPPPPNTAPLCGVCGVTSFCQTGMTCVQVDMAGTNECAKFCCTDADCGGAPQSCNTTLIGDGVGMCVTVNPDGTLAPLCMGIPATPPSMGSCVP